MDQKTLLIALLALIIGLGCGSVLSGAFVSRSHVMPDGTVMYDSSMSMHGAMEGMMAGLDGKEGDAFDRAFLDEMIVHHEGALEMAEAALLRAQHAEVKDLSRAIIEAQEREIEQMKQWLRAWYGAEARATAH